jgi:hypothetical protein
MTPEGSDLSTVMHLLEQADQCVRVEDVEELAAAIPNVRRLMRRLRSSRLKEVEPSMVYRLRPRTEGQKD